MQRFSWMEGRVSKSRGTNFVAHYVQNTPVSAYIHILNHTKKSIGVLAFRGVYLKYSYLALKLQDESSPRADKDGVPRAVHRLNGAENVAFWSFLQPRLKIQ